jgi:hypothetical protein
MKEITIKIQFSVLLILVAIFIPYLLNRPIVHHAFFYLFGEEVAAKVQFIKEIPSTINSSSSRRKKYLIGTTARLPEGREEELTSYFATEQSRASLPLIGSDVVIHYINLGPNWGERILVEELSYYYPSLKWSYISILGSLLIWYLLAFLYVTRERGTHFRDHYCQ